MLGGRGGVDAAGRRRGVCEGPFAKRGFAGRSARLAADGQGAWRSLFPQEETDDDCARTLESATPLADSGRNNPDGLAGPAYRPATAGGGHPNNRSDHPLLTGRGRSAGTRAAKPTARTGTAHETARGAAPPPPAPPPTPPPPPPAHP